MEKKICICIYNYTYGRFPFVGDMYLGPISPNSRIRQHG